jgi:hypothetical protein
VFIFSDLPMHKIWLNLAGWIIDNTTDCLDASGVNISWCTDCHGTAFHYFPLFSGSMLG